MDDPAVTSVRVAVALIDRFAELLKGPAQVAAFKQKGALVGFSGNQDELSLRLGEAQQVYPEIWRHLDDARAGFTARGIDVTAYDQLRAMEGDGLAAAPDTRYREYHTGHGALQTHVKTANFNYAGFQRARAASIALMRATPQIDWGAIAKAEQDDPAVAAFGRATRSRRWMWFAILGVLLASPFIFIFYLQHRERARLETRDDSDPAPTAEPLAGDDLEKLRADVAAVGKRLATARATWDRVGTFGGLTAIEAGTAPCPAAPPAPPAAAADAFIRSGTEDRALDASSFVAYIAGPADRKLPNRELTSAERTASMLDQRVRAGTVTASDAAQLAALPHQVAIAVIDKNVEPAITQTAPMTYTPGEVTGHGYVFSLDTGTVVCAGAFTVRNPLPPEPPDLLSRARRSNEATDLLHRQLEIRIRQALASLPAAKTNF